MEGDKILKIYGGNVVMYEIDKGWVVPEIAPDPEYYPPYKPPSTDPKDLELIEGVQWVTGRIDPKLPPTEELVAESARYTTRWIKVKPNKRYIISCKYTNAFVLQSKSTTGVITHVSVPSSVTTANTAIQAKADAEYIRFYFYVGYENLHEISLQEFVVADPGQIPPFKVTVVESGYIDGNKAALQKDPYVFNKTTGWFAVKPNTKYLMYFSQSNRCYLQFRGKVVASNGSVSYPITYVTDPASDTSANNRYFTTKADTIEARVHYAANLYNVDDIQMFEQLPTQQ